MRGTNMDRPADQTQEQPGGEPAAAVPDPSEIGRSIDAVEERRAALDQELSEMRGTAPAPQREMAAQELDGESQADIDRALAWDREPEPGPEQTLQEGTLEDYVAPERWTDRGGMVEQQASAMEWLQHSDEVRRERVAQAPTPAAEELTQDDRELLDAARTSEAQVPQQDLVQSPVPEPSGP